MLEEASNYTRFDLTLSEHSYVTFSESYLKDLWAFSDTLGPIIVEPPWALNPLPTYVVRFHRRPAIPFVQLILPTILCHLLLGSSMVIERRKLELRLRVYLPLFVLAPTLLLSMQLILPSHGAYGLLLPEALLINLIVATTIFAVGSIVHPESDSKGQVLDGLAVAFAIGISSFTFIFGLPFFNIQLLSTFIVTVIALIMGSAKEWIELLRE